MKKSLPLARKFGCSGRVAPSTVAFNPADRINIFWFQDSLREDVFKKSGWDHMKRWYIADEKFDEACKEFLPFYEWAARGELTSWNATRHGCLAHILLLDQFPRNLFRNNPKTYATDDMALALTRETIQRGHEKRLHTLERIFVGMPYQHAEDLEAQLEGIEAFKRILMESKEPFKEVAQSSLDYSIQHKDIVERFGRFPHRNEILGRESTPEELKFLEGGRGF